MRCSVEPFLFPWSYWSAIAARFCALRVRSRFVRRSWCLPAPAPPRRTSRRNSGEPPPINGTPAGVFLRRRTRFFGTATSFQQSVWPRGPPIRSGPHRPCWREPALPQAATRGGDGYREPVADARVRAQDDQDRGGRAQTAKRGAMDSNEANMCRKVADAADAWLREPFDADRYRRLVACVELLRGFREPSLPVSGATVPQEDELLDELAEERPAVPLSEVLGTGDPREALERLRQGQAAAGGATVPERDETT